MTDVEANLTDEVESVAVDTTNADEGLESVETPEAGETPETVDAAETPRLPALPGKAPGPLQATDSFALAGRSVMWSQVERLLARETVIRDPAESDALRRYRVATRRLRAAIRLFRPAYSTRDTRPLREGLSDLADVLGAVRDIDVRLGHLKAWAADRGGAAAEAVRPMIEEWVRDRERAAAALARELDARRHRRLLERLVAFVTATSAEKTGGSPRRPGRLTVDRTASSLWTSFETVRAYGPAIPWADLRTLHEVRVEAKRLRYAIEFLSPILGPDHRLLVERLVALQDHLGALNDAAVEAAAVRSFLSERHLSLTDEQRAAAAAYLDDRERAAGRLRRGVRRVWRPIAGIAFAKRLGRVVVVRPVAAPSPASGPSPARGRGSATASPDRPGARQGSGPRAARPSRLAGDRAGSGRARPAGSRHRPPGPSPATA